MQKTYPLLIELDKLKSTYRRSYITDRSRRENSAEHSWHLALALLALKDFMPPEINIDHALRIALVHDVCEIGPGDMPIHSPDRSKKALEEKAFMDEFAARHKGFAVEIKTLWEEYEVRETLESRWVEVVDRLLPFMLNLATDGELWQETKITKSQVLKVNTPIARTFPELYQWIEAETEIAIKKGWLLDE